MDVGDRQALAASLRAQATDLLKAADGLDVASDSGNARSFFGESTALFRAGFATGRGANVSSGTELSAGLKIFHDAVETGVHWVQRPLGLPAEQRFALALTTYRFDGSFHSLAIDVDGDALPELLSFERAYLSCKVLASRPVKMFLRLNLYRDGDQEALHDAIIVRDSEVQGSFRMGDLSVEMRGGTSGWVDLIFSEPGMSDIEISELSLTAHPVFAA